MVYIKDNVSKRLESERWVVEDERKMPVTRRLSTFVSEDEHHNRRSAFMWCSSMLTAVDTEGCRQVIMFIATS